MRQITTSMRQSSYLGSLEYTELSILKACEAPNLMNVVDFGQLSIAH
jgi:hypothetical protein